jgi:hypothetical protein
MNNQWRLVPVEPTETMVINGFESVPNECFTDEEVWEQYQEMSGCQQAAFRAKLCWAAMLASAPSAPAGGQPEVVAVIREEGEHFKETVVEHRPGIDRLPAGTELVDRAHVIRLQAERDALQLRLNAADQRIDELMKPAGSIVDDAEVMIVDHQQFIAGEYEDLIDKASEFQDRAYALGLARGILRSAALDTPQ